MLSIPVIGVIEPGSRAAASATMNKKIGVIGTEATIRSNAYLTAIKAIDPAIEVFGLPCPLFVPLVEEGWTEGLIAQLIVQRYLEGMKDTSVDTVVLGCTHYPLLKPVIQRELEDVSLIDSAIETARAVKELLVSSGQLRQEDPEPVRKFFVTDLPEKFIRVAEQFLNNSIENIERIQL